MSLYREAGRGGAGRIAAAAIAGLLVGAALGLLLGSGGDEDEPSLEQAVGGVQDEVRPALSALELVGIEYPEAVRGGEVVAETEYEAALAQAERAEATVAGAAADLRVLSPRKADAATNCLARLVEEIEATSPSGAVERNASRCAAGIRAAARF